MKICPACDQTYADDNLNYCLNDGKFLTVYNDDAPPTVMLNRAAPTQPNWENFQTFAPLQSQPFDSRQTSSLEGNQTFYPAQAPDQNQILPTVSLVLGIFAIVFTCCYGGVPFGAAALALGYLGLRNANENPMRYGGRGLAIAGIVTGVIGLLISVVIFLIAIAAS